jgi:hypothetical protein
MACRSQAWPPSHFDDDRIKDLEEQYQRSLKRLKGIEEVNGRFAS